MSTLLEVKDVCKRYGKKTALDHLNLTLESGTYCWPLRTERKWKDNTD